MNANSCFERNLELCLSYLRPVLLGGIPNVFQDTPTYINRRHDGIMVQSTAALSLTVKQHPLFIQHVSGKDSILKNKTVPKEIIWYVRTQCEEENMEGFHQRQQEIIWHT